MTNLHAFRQSSIYRDAVQKTAKERKSLVVSFTVLATGGSIIALLRHSNALELLCVYLGAVLDFVQPYTETYGLWMAWFSTIFSILLLSFFSIKSDMAVEMGKAIIRQGDTALPDAGNANLWALNCAAYFRVAAGLLACFTAADMLAFGLNRSLTGVHLFLGAASGFSGICSWAIFFWGEEVFSFSAILISEKLRHELPLATGENSPRASTAEGWLRSSPGLSWLKSIVKAGVLIPTAARAQEQIATGLNNGTDANLDEDDKIWRDSLARELISLLSTESTPASVE